MSLRRLRGDLVYNKHTAQLNVFCCFSLLFAAVVCNGIANQPFVSFTDFYSFMQFAMQSMCSNSLFSLFFFLAHAHCITWCSSAAALFILQSVFLKLKKKKYWHARKDCCCMYCCLSSLTDWSFNAILSRVDGTKPYFVTRMIKKFEVSFHFHCS